MQLQEKDATINTISHRNTLKENELKETKERFLSNKSRESEIIKE